MLRRIQNAQIRILNRRPNILLDQPLNDDITMAATEALRAEISPIDDVRSSRDYRLQVSLNLLQDFLRRLSTANSQANRMVS